MILTRRITMLVCAISLSFAFGANAAQRLIARKPLALKYESFSTTQLATFADRGVVILEDYGPFAVLEAPNSVDTAALAAVTNVWITKDELAHHLRLAGFDIDTSSGALPVGVDADLQFADYSGSTGLYTIQFHGPIRPEWLQLLEARGVRRLNYVEQNAYVVAAPKGLEELKSALQSSSVQHVGVLQPAYKIAPSIRRIPAADVSHWNLTALLDRGQDLTSTLAQIAAIDPAVSTTPYGLSGKRVSFVGTASEARMLARLSTVTWIEVVPTATVSDERVASMAVGNATPGGYQNWLVNHGLTDQPVIQVVDSGVQLSSTALWCTPGYPWLSGGHIDLNNDAYTKSRLAAACPTCGTSLLADGLGHGTLVASIIAGNPLQQGGGLAILGNAGARDTNGTGYYWGTGVFPSARILSTKLIADSGVLPDLSARTREARAYGALFQNNSWNYTDTTYSSASSEFDAIVRYGGSAQDDTPVTVVFSAGNGSGAVRSPATAKNVIAVGASGMTHSDLPGTCNSTDSYIDVTSTSRRGFEPNGVLIKPDLMAPGLVAGARSSAITWSDCTQSTLGLPGTGDYYYAASGTSFSAPQVTGLAALTSSIYTGNPPSFGHNWPNGFWSTPSPAMLKATLIASADSMRGGVDRATSSTLGWEPGTAQGWGRLSLERFYDSTYKFAVEQSRLDEFLFTYTGETKNWTLTVDDPSKETVFVLAWSDVAGSAGATNPMVNQIAMYVWQGQNMYCDGYYGSHYITPTNACYIAPDTHNNVKVLRIAPGMSGTFTIQLYGWNIAEKAWAQDPNHYQNQDWAFFGYNIRVP